MRFFSIIITVLFFTGLKVAAQPGAEVELKKPEKYENRKLASEKTGEKKFTIPRRIMQNVSTHYNYYFNANNRLNEVIARAKSSFKDDYSQLLPFYNYTLQSTAQDKGELDSVIYKATAGILLHDLRSDWVDNMYLMMAKAYFYRNDLDSATYALQYLNFAFAPKEEGGYDIPIGSNASNETGEFSIATKEKGSVLKKITSRPPSRNESFIWQIRTSIEHNDLPEAAGLIEILKNDPQFPERLQPQLKEVTAYWFYKQNIHDSAAAYLSDALDGADNSQEKARWEYLIGQLYQRAGNSKLAQAYYDRSINHTNDPVMDVYARLNTLKLTRADGKDYAQESIDALLKMAKRDKYLNYRDIIYYAAATIELDRKKFDAAETDLLNSVKFTNNNQQQRSQSFLLLGDMNYDRKKYTPAFNFYDSTDINALKDQQDKDRIILRKPALKIVAANEFVIKTEDSLQALAALPAAKRENIIKAKARELRKAKGIKEEEPSSVNPAIQQQQAADLFGDNAKNTDFYFYNASLKARGFNEFKTRWGQRPNVDNWRRSAVINRQSTSPQDMNISDIPTAQIPGTLTDISYEGLLASLPLTEEKLVISNTSIEESLNTLGETFLSKMEDYPSAIFAYEELLRRFPNSGFKDKAMLNLVYAYSKTDNRDKAEATKRQLTTGSDTSRYAQLLKNPEAFKQPDKAKAAITKKYEQVYNMFIEGDFENAKAEKKIADSTYGKSYWTPQLLYIESIYYVSNHEDSTAKKVLTDLVNTFPNNPMAEKAKTMIDVLGRRAQIEDYLTKLEVTRNGDGPSLPAPARQQQQLATSTKAAPTSNPIVIKKDSVASPIKAPAIAPPVAVVKEDKPVVTPPVKKDSAAPLVKTPVITPPATIVKQDKPVVTPPAKNDTVAKIAAPIAVKSFTFKPADAHFVVVVLDKVDPVYANEAKNAFNRYNREKFYNKQIEMTSLKLDDRYQLVLQGPFSDANAAVDYIDNVRPVAASRIVPWLKGDKFSFIVISNDNLEVLKTNVDFTAYKQLLQQAFPGKF